MATLQLLRGRAEPRASLYPLHGRVLAARPSNCRAHGPNLLLPLKPWLGARRGVIRRPCSRSAAPVPRASAGGGAQPAGRNLLVAVDSSEDSQYACQWLLDNVYREGDTVHVVHCIPYYPRSGVYVMPDGRLATLDFDVLLRNEDQFLMAAEKAVSDWCAAVLEPAKVRYVVDLLREAPGAEDKDIIGAAICSKARELQATVLVIASQVKSGLSEFFLGSVASYCSHHCDSPTLVLHRPKSGNSGGGGLKSWLPDLSAMLAPKVTAEAVGATAAAAAAVAAKESGNTSSSEDVFSSVVKLSQREAAAAAQQPASAGASSNGILTSQDLPPGEDNLLGQTADFPGIGSQAESSFADSAAAQHAQQEREQAAKAAAVEAARAAAGGRHIVLAVDDSDESERACEWAARNLWRPGDCVNLMHIIPAMPYRATYGGPVMDGFVFYMDVPTEDFKKATQLYVGKRFVNKLESLGIPHQVEILVERAEDSAAGIGSAICKHVAELEGPSIVVVGSHMRGGLAEFMLGSVASYLTHHCASPVAVLHGNN